MPDVSYVYGATMLQRVRFWVGLAIFGLGVAIVRLASAVMGASFTAEYREVEI